MAEALEIILLKLLQPENLLIQQATIELKEMAKRPDIVPLFYQLLSNSTKVEVRQYAAVLLRRKLLKKNVWNSLSPNISQEIKQNLISDFLKEHDVATKKSLSQLIAKIGQHDIPGNKWPELFQFIDASLKDIQTEEIGMNLLMIVSSAASNELKPHISNLLQVCTANIKKTTSLMIPFYTIKTLINLIPSVEIEHQKPFQLIIPDVIVFIKQLVLINQELSVECLEIFEELIISEVPLLSPHIRPSFQLFLEISKTKNLEAPLRVRGLTLISDLIEKKKKLILKLNTIPRLIEDLFAILCENETKDDDSDEDLEAEISSPSSTAGQVLDMMALHFPPEKLIPPLMKQITPAFDNENPNIQRAAFLALAVVTEGCSENIKNKHLNKLMKIIFKGMTSEHSEVRNAAMYAMGEFCDYMQPEVGKFSQDLLPLLFNCLARLSDPAAGKNRDVIKIYYALEKFCENLGKDILPYLPQLLQFLKNTISNAAASDNVKELAIRTLSAISVSAGEDMVPYISDFFETLKLNLFLTEEEGSLIVQTQTLDTYGQFARNFGDCFKSYAAELVLLGLRLIHDSSDPDLRQACFSLFGSCATLLKEDMGPHLSTIVPMLFKCMVHADKNTVENFNDEKIDIFNSDDEDDNEDHDEANDDRSFELLNEKVEAISTLGDIAMNTGFDFWPYMEQSFKETKVLLLDVDPDIRDCAATTVGQLCSAAVAIFKKNPELEASYGQDYLNKLNETMTKLFKMCREEEDREVVISVLKSIKDTIDNIGIPAISALDSLQNLMNLVKDVIQGKVKCQENSNDDYDDDDDDDDDNAEYDSVIIESAGELLVTIAKVIGGEKFAPYFATILPEFVKKMKKNSSVSDKSFSVGTCAEVLQEMGPYGNQFCLKLYPNFMNSAKDCDEEVRNNSIYGIGIVAANGGEAMIRHYDEIIKLLSETLAKEDNERCRNNICAAVCRMIIANQQNIPIAHVLPTIVNNLPFKEDLIEHKTVFQCFSNLYFQRSNELLNQLPGILKAICEICMSKVEQDLRDILKPMLMDLNMNYNQEFSVLVSSFPPQAVETLKNILQQ